MPVSPAIAIDLYQGNTVLGDQDEGFAQVKAQGIFILDHKASQGTSEVDSMCAFRRERWMTGASVSVPGFGNALSHFGFYHFNGTGTPQAEAAHFISTIKPTFEAGDDAILDWEDWQGQRSAQWADDFCNAVEQWLGHRMRIYTGNTGREQCAIASVPDKVIESLGTRRLWFCDYGAFNPSYIPLPWRGKPPYLWQDDGDQYGPGIHKLPGLTGWVDNSTVAGGQTVAGVIAGWGK